MLNSVSNSVISKSRSMSCLICHSSRSTTLDHAALTQRMVSPSPQPIDHGGHGVANTFHEWCDTAQLTTEHALARLCLAIDHHHIYIYIYIYTPCNGCGCITSLTTSRTYTYGRGRVASLCVSQLCVATAKGVMNNGWLGVAYYRRNPTGLTKLSTIKI